MTHTGRGACHRGAGGGLDDAPRPAAGVDRIHVCWRRPRSQSAVLVLRGAAGIGKSALLRRGTRRYRGHAGARCHGTESETRLPFAALHQSLRPVLGHAEAIPAVQARRCAARSAWSSWCPPSPSSSRSRRSASWPRRPSAQPLLCLVDDAQWLDEATADALPFVAGRLDAESIAMLFEAREERDARLEAPGLAELARYRRRRRGRARIVHRAAAAGGLRPRSPTGSSARRTATRSPCSSSRRPSRRSRPRGLEPILEPFPISSHLERAFLEARAAAPAREPAAACWSPPPTRAAT